MGRRRDAEEMQLVTDELAIAIRPFFEDRRGPAMHELEEAFAILDVNHLDPEGESPRPLSKATRIERVLVRATSENNQRGWEVFAKLIELVRAHDGFRPTSADFPGTDAFTTLRSVLRRAGYDLDDAGILRATVFEGLGHEETVAGIRSVIDRARRSGDDAALVTASSKEIVEAAARCVIQSLGHAYDPKANLPTTVETAFKGLGLSVPGFDKATKQFVLGGSEWERLSQAIYVVACELGRFRNEFGLGHGRPEPSTVSTVQAGVAAEISGAVASVLLNLMGTPRPQVTS